MLTPRQELGSAEVTWEQTRVTGSEPIPVRVSKKLHGEEGLLTEYAGTRLRMDLDRVPLWPADAAHVSTQQLWSYYAQYLYLPRLRDRAVLAGAIEQGVSSLAWEQETFAYADALDDGTGRYVGLVAGSGALVRIDGASVVVKPEAARKQLDEDVVTAPVGSAVPLDYDPTFAQPVRPVESAATTPTRFFGAVQLDAMRMSRDAGQVADEVVKHLAGLVDADVDVRLEITAKSEGGFPDEVVRTVTENAKTLKFEPHGFEES
jgi:hypothetical protein